MNNKKSAKNTVIAICLFVVVFGALLAAATFFDLEVSKILAKVNVGEYFTTSVFGAIFESIGSWPVYAMLSAAFAIIYSNTKRSSVKLLKILGSIAANVASVIAMAVLVFDTVDYITRHVSVPTGEAITSVFAKVVCVFIAAACGELMCYAFARLSDEKAKALLKFSYSVRRYSCKYFCQHNQKHYVPPEVQDYAMPQPTRRERKYLLELPQMVSEIQNARGGRSALHSGFKRS